jgi:hypothetical protein
MRRLSLAMRAMVFDGPGRPLREAVLPDPEPGPGELLVAVSACGVCRTDLHIVDGELPLPRLPLVPGHEGAGQHGPAEAEHGPEPLQIFDLMERWQLLTGLPFVFAFWGVRSGVDLDDPSVFRQSFAYGETHLDEIVQQQSQTLQLPEDQLHHYLTENINYTLDQENLEGLQLFYQLAADTLGMDMTRAVEFVE